MERLVGREKERVMGDVENVCAVNSSRDSRKK